MQTTDDTLKTFYSQFGTVSDCVVMKDTTTRRSRGFGFVTFARLEDVDAAMNARPHNIDGKVVDPKRAVPREASQKNEANISTKRLYVSGVREDHNEQMFEEYFGKYGQIEKVEIIKDKNTGKCRGFAFITFNDYDPVDKCCLERQHMVGGHRCDVKKALSKEEIAKAQQMDRDRAERGQRSRGNTRGAWMPNNQGSNDRWNVPPGGYGGPQSYGPPGGPPYGYGPGWSDPNSGGWNQGGPWSQPGGNPYGGGYSSQGPPNPQNWTNPSSWGGPRY